MTLALTYVEIDIEAFPQDSPQLMHTYRFAVDARYLPTSIDAIPSIKEVKIDPAQVSLGEDLGTRATVTATFKDHRHIFDGEPFDSGTFWGKFRARYGLRLQGFDLRVITGKVGQAIGDMEHRHFVIESTDGPRPNGEFQIIAKDILKLADGDRSQAPVLNNGFLVANITSSATTLTLSPAGIGDAEYPGTPNDFYIAIGGSEIARVTTRAGDVLTIVRGELNTSGVAHNAQDRVQVVLNYSAVNPADVIFDLLTNYADIPDDYIDIGAWENEINTYLSTVYTANITEPTSVADLVSELIEQVGLVMWWDDVAQQIRLQVLRPIASTADVYSGDNYLAGSLDIKEQPEKRLTQVYTYFAKINPLVAADQLDNYRSTSFVIDEVAEADYGTPVIKKIFSRWIPDGGRAVADTLGGILLARFRDPPRRISFNVLRGSGNAPILGVGYQIKGWPLQEIDGSAAMVPAQITRLNPRADIFEIEVEEISDIQFGGGGGSSPGEHHVIIDADIFDVNLRDMHDSIYGTPVSGNVVICTIGDSVIVGSTSTSARAFDVGTWPGGVTIRLIVSGRIEGRGGNGGVGVDNVSSPQAAATGQAGGPALFTRQVITLDASSGQIWGGGGGGGGSGSTGNVGGTPLDGGNGGGGGTGKNPGGGGGPGGGLNAGLSGNAGTTEAGGTGGGPGLTGVLGGQGGGPGLAGSTGSTPGAPTHTVGGPGGAAGRSIDGISFITFVGSSPSGDIRGPQVN